MHVQYRICAHSLTQKLLSHTEDLSICDSQNHTIYAIMIENMRSRSHTNCFDTADLSQYALILSHKLLSHRDVLMEKIDLSHKSIPIILQICDTSNINNMSTNVAALHFWQRCNALLAKVQCTFALSKI